MAAIKATMESIVSRHVLATACTACVTTKQGIVYKDVQLESMASSVMKHAMNIVKGVVSKTEGRVKVYTE